MKKYINQKVILTTSAWFYAPNGETYNAVWGTLKNIYEAKQVFGFVPNRTHANWFIEIGDMVIAGCQVNYCVLSPQAPPPNVSSWTERDHELDRRVSYYERPSKIYHTS